MGGLFDFATFSSLKMVQIPSYKRKTFRMKWSYETNPKIVDRKSSYLFYVADIMSAWGVLSNMAYERNEFISCMQSRRLLIGMRSPFPKEKQIANVLEESEESGAASWNEGSFSIIGWLKSQSTDLSMFPPHSFRAFLTCTDVNPISHKFWIAAGSASGSSA